MPPAWRTEQVATSHDHNPDPKPKRPKDNLPVFVITAEFVLDIVRTDAVLTNRTVPSTFTLKDAQAIAEAITNAPRPRIADWDYLTAEEREYANECHASALLEEHIEALYA